MNELPARPTVWTLAAFAARVGVDAAWLREELAAGRLPGAVAGRTWLVDPEAVEAALLARARGGVPNTRAPKVAP
jgi:hypothetical protein